MRCKALRAASFLSTHDTIKTLAMAGVFWFNSDKGGFAMVLDNKLGITSSANLAREEERISKKKAVELFEKGLLNQLAAGTFSSL